MTDPGLGRAKIVFSTVIALILIGFTLVGFVEWSRPDKDNTTLITIILGLLTPTIFSILAYLKATETHYLLNGRMTELLAKTEGMAHAEGVASGRLQQQVTAQELALKNKGE